MDEQSDISEVESGVESDAEEDAPPTAQRSVFGPWVTVPVDDSYAIPFPPRPFSRIPGPLTALNVEASPIEYFDIICQDHINNVNLIDLLVAETNRYAGQTIVRPLTQYSRMNEWQDTDQEEMRAFLGLLLGMGIVKKPSIESYWNMSEEYFLFHVPSYGKILSRNRFQNILRFLHCNDNDTANPRGHANYDPGHKIRPIINLFNHSFPSNYQLNRDVSIDESMVGFKGRNNLVQYMPGKKTHRWGAKLFVLAESDTGFTHKVMLYTGKQQNRVPYRHGLGYHVVTSLLENYQNINHHVVMDNAFSSPILCHHLYGMGIYTTGTVRAYRKGMPQSFKSRKMAKGERIARQQGPVLAMKYGDRKDVVFLSTFGKPSIVATVNSRGVNKQVPQIADTYNKKMGGVDLADEHIQNYDPNLRSVKLWKKILVNMLLRAIANAYIIYQHNRGEMSTMSRLEFNTSICHSLVGDFRVKRHIHRQPGTRHSRLEERHFIEYLPGSSRGCCVVCMKREDRKRKIRTYCPDCNVALCIGVCFRLYHTRLNYGDQVAEE